MLNYFEFDGENSLDYNILIRNKNCYNAPQKNISIISVPGRDGDIIIDKKTYKNIKVSYGIALAAKQLFFENKNIDLAYAVRDFNNFITKKQGQYYKLTDSYDPDYYRLACINNAIEWTTKSENFAVSNIEFTCKPYKYLKAGEQKITVFDSVTLLNPESSQALPIINIYGDTGLCSFVVNGLRYQVDFTDIAASKITIDSENQTVGTTTEDHYNVYTAPSSTLFPVLNAGNITITISGNTSKIEILPRWRTL